MGAACSTARSPPDEGGGSRDLGALPTACHPADHPAPPELRLLHHPHGRLDAAVSVTSDTRKKGHNSWCAERRDAVRVTTPLRIEA
jgi:hypothetical protein